jgi:hypothetical protein
LLETAEAHFDIAKGDLSRIDHYLPMGNRNLNATIAKGIITMFQCLDIFGRKQQEFKNPAANELSVELIMPPVYQGKAVPPSIVMMELLWQQYGLDMLHPEVSRWLERNAPDVKYAAARNQFTSDNDSAQFTVGPQGTVELHLSLKFDDRLREVSSQYILSQVEHPMEPETEPQLAA